MAFKTKAYIYSLNRGKMQSDTMDDITVLEEAQISPEQKGYIVDYKGTKCYAIFNWFTCAYYADDVYGIVK